MAYNYEYPYTDSSRYNSDWLLNRMKELEQQIIGLEESILAKAEQYIDSKLIDYVREVQQLRIEFNELQSAVNNEIALFETQTNAEIEQFKAVVTAQITLLSGRISGFEALIDSKVAAANARTDRAIEQNNDYLFTVLESYLNRLTVLNMFTGERMTVQEMFNYLGDLHALNGITAGELIEADKTAGEFIAYNMSAYDLITNGKNIIV